MLPVLRIDGAVTDFSRGVREFFSGSPQLQAFVGSPIAMALDKDFAHEAADSKKSERDDDLNDFRRHALGLMVREERDRVVREP
jgi:hypothetical protein